MGAGGGENALGGVAQLVVKLFRRQGREDGDGVLFRTEAALNVQRRPGASASFSAMQKLYLPLWPRVLRSSRPGRVPMTLRITSRSARPMAALARQPGPKRLSPWLRSNSCAMGPFTTASTARAAGARRRAVIAPQRVAHGFHRGHQHGHVLRLATGHDAVDRHLLGGHRHLAIVDEGDLRLRLQSGRFPTFPRWRSPSAAPPAGRPSSPCRSKTPPPAPCPARRTAWIATLLPFRTHLCSLRPIVAIASCRPGHGKAYEY